MKLRIRGNSLRLRLTRGEVDRVAQDGFIEESVAFGGAQKLTYVLRAADVPALHAEMQEHRITVSVPKGTLHRWATNEEVGIEGAQPIDEGSLLLLVEKDFACLTERREDDTDAFPNPNASC